MHDEKRLRTEAFFQHPMNRLMLEDGGLPMYDPQELAVKYIGLAKTGELPTEEVGS